MGIGCNDGKGVIECENEEPDVSCEDTNNSLSSGVSHLLVFGVEPA